MHRIDLSGQWRFRLDKEKRGFPTSYEDVIELPGTTSYRSKGEPNEAREVRCLTDAYQFEGFAWFEREVDVSSLDEELDCFLYLERTRTTSLWVDGVFVGSRNSLTTPHRYYLELSRTKHIITICVDNTNYPTKGGHMTSEDTQTNWNGITGRMELCFLNKKRVEDVQVYSDLETMTLKVRGLLVGTTKTRLRVGIESVEGNQSFDFKTYEVNDEQVDIDYPLGDSCVLWSEFNPFLYRVKIDVVGGDVTEVITGIRTFKADRDKFTINGNRTFLRGKHDGLIFPDTGFAPTSAGKWLEILGIAKEYGINHYRFHTCCPPEAAFEAADQLGIYMQPELPFWGTITVEGEKNHNQEEQDYLIKEGFEMLKTFGNHPSFVMMSLGNELWGNKEVLSKILREYKAFDPRHLYTQGSNNFQFAPTVLPEDDFFSGVRLSKERLIRGSYAMCDAPLGHVQTQKPGTWLDYDKQFIELQYKDDASGTNGTTTKEFGTKTLEIQYGTTTKKVEMSQETEGLHVTIPVITHEIGQYQTYPDFNEITRYTGPLKARNFECFRERLEEKGLGKLAHAYFVNSGKFAIACYKEELEAAFRSRQLAGFQLLDLQDFSGQGTALIGVLNAFMESKGLIHPERWRNFCSDLVLLARFTDYNRLGESRFEAEIQIANYRHVARQSDRRLNHYLDQPLNQHLNQPLNQYLDGHWEKKTMQVHWSLKTDYGVMLESGSFDWEINDVYGVVDIGMVEVQLPKVMHMTKVLFELWLEGTDRSNMYTLYIYPKNDRDLMGEENGDYLLTDEWNDAKAALLMGEKVLLFPKLDALKQSIEGFYCTDFWCYPMFRAISESVDRPVPVGTLGLLIQNKHKALEQFLSEEYSTPQWWPIVTASRALVLDHTDEDFRPIVQTIDNFERNHKLGTLFECRVGNGNLMVCTCDREVLKTTMEGKQFLKSVSDYVASEFFRPESSLKISELDDCFKTDIK